MTHEEEAAQALKDLLAELPAEFSGPVGETRDSFEVRKRRNVRKVHESLLVLQEYFGV